MITAVVVMALLVNRKKETPPHFTPVATAKNPSPRSKTDNPELYGAQKTEIEYLKRHGQYFGWNGQALKKPIEARKEKSLRSEMQQQQQQRHMQSQSMVVENPAQIREKKMLWAMFWKGNPPGKIKGVVLADAAAVTGSSQITSAMEGFNPRPGCPVSGELLRGSYATTRSNTPVLIKITDPANCAGLPAGTIVIASARANYSTFRAVTNVTKISLPNGHSYKATGEVLGTDGLPGIGYKVIRNDRKGLAIGSVVAGFGQGFNAIAQNVGTNTIVTQSGIIQEPQNEQSNLVVGGGEALGTLGTDLANGIAGEYNQISPIVVTMPQGLPVEVVFGVSARHQ